MENEYKVEETDFGTRTSHPSYGTIMFNRSMVERHHYSEAALNIVM